MYPPQVPGFPSHAPSYPPQSNPGYPPQTPAFTQNQYSPSSTNSSCYPGQNPYPSHQATPLAIPYNNQNYPTIPNSTMPQHGGYPSSGCVPISMTQSYSDSGPAIRKSKVCIFKL